MFLPKRNFPPTSLSFLSNFLFIYFQYTQQTTGGIAFDSLLCCSSREAAGAVEEPRECPNGRDAPQAPPCYSQDEEEGENAKPKVERAGPAVNTQQCHNNSQQQGEEEEDYQQRNFKVFPKVVGEETRVDYKVQQQAVSVNNNTNQGEDSDYDNNQEEEGDNPNTMAGVEDDFKKVDFNFKNIF